MGTDPELEAPAYSGENPGNGEDPELEASAYSGENPGTGKWVQDRMFLSSEMCYEMPLRHCREYIFISGRGGVGWPIPR